MKPTAEILLFIVGWLGKGIIFGLGSEIIFRPVSKRIWRYLRRKAESVTYVKHHVERHTSYNINHCELCLKQPSGP